MLAGAALSAGFAFDGFSGVASPGFGGAGLFDFGSALSRWFFGGVGFLGSPSFLGGISTVTGGVTASIRFGRVPGCGGVAGGGVPGCGGVGTGRRRRSGSCRGRGLFLDEIFPVLQEPIDRVFRDDIDAAFEGFFLGQSFLLLLFVVLPFLLVVLEFFPHVVDSVSLRRRRLSLASSSFFSRSFFCSSVSPAGAGVGWGATGAASLGSSGGRGRLIIDLQSEIVITVFIIRLDLVADIDGVGESVKERNRGGSLRISRRRPFPCPRWWPGH